MIRPTSSYELRRKSSRKNVFSTFRSWALSMSRACRELRGEVDVHEPGHAEAAEERASALRAPDEARADDRAALDLLVGPDLHRRAHPGALVDHGMVADDRALLEDDAGLQRALPA